MSELHQAAGRHRAPADCDVSTSRDAAAAVVDDPDQIKIALQDAAMRVAATICAADVAAAEVAEAERRVRRWTVRVAHCEFWLQPVHVTSVKAAARASHELVDARRAARAAGIYARTAADLREHARDRAEDLAERYGHDIERAIEKFLGSIGSVSTAESSPGTDSVQEQGGPWDPPPDRVDPGLLRALERLAALMPADERDAWLQFGISVLRDADPSDRALYRRSLLRTAPRVILTSWRQRVQAPSSSPSSCK